MWYVVHHHHDYDEGEYHNTSLAHHGDRGSKLPALPTGIVWKAGGTAEVRVIIIIMTVMLTVIIMMMETFSAHYVLYRVEDQVLHRPSGRSQPTMEVVTSIDSVLPVSRSQRNASRKTL